MPDYAERAEFEAAIAAPILAAFDQAKGQAEGAGVNWGTFESSIEAQAKKDLDMAFVAVYLFMLDDSTVSAGGMRFASSWSSEASKRIATDLTLKSRLRLDNGAAPGSVFSSQRAAGIAATETTRLVTAAETAARREVASRKTDAGDGREGGEGPLDVGDGLAVFWFTERDGRVCEICEPLHRQPYEVWRLVFPDGPPGHPNCRCWVVYQAAESIAPGLFSGPFLAYLEESRAEVASALAIRSSLRSLALLETIGSSVGL